MQFAALKLTSQKQVMGHVEVYKYWVIRIKIPNVEIPSWVIPTVEVLGLILFTGILNGIIGI